MRPQAHGVGATVLIAVALVLPGAADVFPLKPLVLRQGESSRAEIARSAAISSDGRFVAFTSDEPLASTDRNVVQDVYVFDRALAELSLESTSPAGLAANGGSGCPSISADGRRLTFDSEATNLSAARDDNGRRDVFVRDRVSGSTRLLSAVRDGGVANGMSSDPVISADGRVVAFVSHATNLVSDPDSNGAQSDVYLADLESGVMRRLGALRDSLGVSSRAFGPAVSGDGRLVVFVTTSPVPPAFRPGRGVLNGLDILAHDASAGTTTCLTCGKLRQKIWRRAHSPSVSADGRFVAFAAEATKGRWPRSDIVVHDRTTDSTLVITREANGPSVRPQLTADGRIVVFESVASNLLCARHCATDTVDDNLVADIYAFDRIAGTFARLSGALGRWWTPSVGPMVDAHGDTVVFSSRQPFGPEDPTVDFDLFVCARACP